MIQDKTIIDSLEKVFNTLYVKNRCYFYIKLSKHKFDPNGTTLVVEVYFVVDQAKYWESSPDFNQEYYDFVFNTNDAEEILDELSKYVISDRLSFTYIYYEHINKDIYDPILGEIKEMGYDCGLSYIKYKEYPIITVFNVDDATIKRIDRDLGKKFNVDDILITNDK